MTHVTMMLALAGALVVGCGGGGQEQEILSGFFRAANYDDRGTMSNVSMVGYDAREQGNVSNVRVQTVSEERRRPLATRERAADLQAAREAEAAHQEKMKMYQDENQEAVVRVIEAQRTGGEVASRDAEVQEMWTQLNQEREARAAAVSNAQQALTAETRVAARSVAEAAGEVDLSSYEGELVSKDVTFTATVASDGSESERTMTATLERVVLGSGEGQIEGRWMITALR